MNGPRRDAPGSSAGRGLSLAGLEMLAEWAGGRNTGDMWANVWITETAPDGWTVEVVRGSFLNVAIVS